jgi:hypothetical protein
MFARNNIYFRLHLLLIIIHITCISLSLRRTSAPMHLTSVLSVLGTQETSCIIITGLLERDTFDLFLPEFDKHWVIHLRKLAAVLQTSALGVVTQHTTACCSIQVVDITLVKYQFTNITSLRVVQQKHSGLYSSTKYYKP